MQERGPDAAVQADPGDHLLDVGSRRVGDPRELVGERDLHPEIDIGAELDQRHGTGIRHQRRGAERLVEVEDGLRGGDIARFEPAGDHPVRPVEVLERLTLAHELGVGDDRRAIRAIRAIRAVGGAVGGVGGVGRAGDECGKPARPVERQGRADDDDVLGPDDGQEAGDRLLDVDGRERSIRSGRRVDADKRERGVGWRVELGREGQRAVRQAARDRLGQAGLEDGRPTVVQAGDSGGVEVGDGDAMAEPCEADRGDQADVAGTEQEEVHEGDLRCRSDVPDGCRNDSIRRPEGRRWSRSADGPLETCVEGPHMREVGLQPLATWGRTRARGSR